MLKDSLQRVLFCKCSLLHNFFLRWGQTRDYYSTTYSETGIEYIHIFNICAIFIRAPLDQTITLNIGIKMASVIYNNLLPSYTVIFVMCVFVLIYLIGLYFLWQILSYENRLFGRYYLIKMFANRKYRDTFANEFLFLQVYLMRTTWAGDTVIKRMDLSLRWVFLTTLFCYLLILSSMIIPTDLIS